MPSGACDSDPRRTQDASGGPQTQSGGVPQKRAQKRKCCDVAEESAVAPDVFNAKSSMCRALTQTPQFLYTVSGEAIPGARSNIQTSGALWSNDAWIEQPSSWQEHRVSVVDPFCFPCQLSWLRVAHGCKVGAIPDLFSFAVAEKHLLSPRTPFHSQHSSQ